MTITLTREEAQQVLDALESDNPDIQLRTAITLRARLAQPEPSAEPVACQHNFIQDDTSPLYYCCQKCGEVKKWGKT